jgi:biopolymer transport protein ExbD
MLKKHKHLDFEINLIPCIDLLSVCICFLLLTAVWMQVGSMNVKQAVGGQAAADTTKKPTLWALVGAHNEVTLDVQDSSHVPAAMRKMKIEPVEGKMNLTALATALDKIKGVEPSLRTALIQPQAASVYEDIITVMDQFKKKGLIDLGVAPL